jgi:DNA sulfur modification protein DndC
MVPLLELRNQLDFRGDDQRARDIQRREFRRLRGAPQLNRTGDALVPGPYTQQARIDWLTRLLEAQMAIRRNRRAPAHVRGIELISKRELAEIRRIWVSDKHEIEDVLPTVYERIVGEQYFGEAARLPAIDKDALSLLGEATEGDRLHYETLRNLLHIEHEFRSSGNVIAKRGLFKELEAAVTSGFFSSRDDAFSWAKAHAAPQPVSDAADFRMTPPSGVRETSGAYEVGPEEAEEFERVV